MPRINHLIAFLTAFAWGYLIYHHWLADSSLLISTSENLYFLTSMWAIMMAAMMLPSAIPMISAFSQSSMKRYGKDFPYSYLFVFAYLFIWMVFSLLLSILQWQLIKLDILVESTGTVSTWLSSVLFLLAGVYQFTSLKNVCLKQCQSPFGFLLNHWQPGKSGAFKMGLVHGGLCVGCCWAQMLLMFAVGLMNINAMALLTLFIALEKSLPANKQFLSQLAGGLLCLWGGLILFI